MKKCYNLSSCLILGLLWMNVGQQLRAAVIYDNSENDLNYRFNPGTNEVGDEILLGSTERYLTNFSFEFWGSNTLSPTTFASSLVEARIRFYTNSGPLFAGYASPGPGTNNFYDSGWFQVPYPTNRATFVFSAGLDFDSGGLFMPVISNMTWSVQFQGMGASDSVGVDLYSPPTVGTNYSDYWELDAGTWMLKTNLDGVPMDFAAQMEATTPEPSVVALGVCGGLALLVASRRLRRKG
jgi:hypothetical protein